MAEPRRRRNLGILAHVDAGKTTLAEQLLFLSGSTRAPGSVDKGTSLSDGLEVERRRGISVRATALSFSWRGVQINLIDTPGHVDFAAEVERSLRVLDGAVLVVSAAEGVQTQTETIWKALGAMALPVLLFANKIDRAGMDSAATLAALRRELSPLAVPVNRATGEGGPGAAAAALTETQRNELVEVVAAGDDALLEDYLEGRPIGDEALQRALAAAVAARRAFPVLWGAAKGGAGVVELLEAIVAYLPAAGADTERPASGVVFRLDHDARLGRVAGVRLFAGRLRTRDRIHNHTAGREEQITQIKRLALNRYEDAGALEAGDIGFLCGLPEARIGDVLGDPERVPGGYRLGEPLLLVQVSPRDESDHAALAAALQQLASEDPHLDFQWHAEERQLQVRIMGAIQTEILTEVLRTRFGVAAEFGAPAVGYRETPARAAYGAESYTMPKPCWAIVRFRVEPGERGSGVTYVSEVDKSDIHPKYQNEIASNLPESLRQGPRGWEVTDAKVTLVEGSHHLLHSRPGDFKLAANMAILKALTESGTRLLEPILAFRIGGPEELAGKVMADVAHMRGSFEPAEVRPGQFELRGRLPLATSMDYASRLSALTGGRATLATHFDGYEECPEEEGASRPYRGVSPLDRAKYILWWRGAITDSVRGPAAGDGPG
ncbi:MAG: translation factor GTPase family protein [Gemmatimonadota bacterium]